VLDDKYVVFKADEWRNWDPEEGGILPIEDCFVIRAQDVFASAVLYAYAHQLQTLVEFHRGVRPVLSDEECERLEDLADRIASKAEQWMRGSPQKLPD
jgi:hypothetical protein